MSAGKMSAGKVLAAVVASLMALVAVGFVFGGGALLWADATQRDDDGYFTSPVVGLAVDSYAITSPAVDLVVKPRGWFPSGQLGNVRFHVAAAEAPVFIGIGPSDAVDNYLSGVAHDRVVRMSYDLKNPVFEVVDGVGTPDLPGLQSFWVASAEGSAPQTLTWDTSDGDWKAVIMNADATPRVAIEMTAGVATDLLVPIAWGLLVIGLIGLSIAAVLLMVAFRQPPSEPRADAESRPVGEGRYPARLEATLDPDVSRWQWLFKWLLAIPHFIVLFFLWLGFMVLTVAAGFSILFTGRYPRSIFDFNVGVLRWTWRVSYYTYGALGSDRYPPFTLAETDYPATFDVEYPEKLSRGLVLIKWWLLAIPQYLIVGFFTTGLIGWATRAGGSGRVAITFGGGLISLLVLVAAFILLFTGRYPRPLFDFVIGLNRWAYRVWAYAALMRDEYPPFHLDQGEFEPVLPQTTPSMLDTDSASPQEGQQ
ncbi:MAG: DUF4389 domain-containing protein [Acidimicrobiia bacterium]|nr:DUF4389 domain-containing protein [Acidimicrobiia bacterium]